MKSGGSAERARVPVFQIDCKGIKISPPQQILIKRFMFYCTCIRNYIVFKHRPTMPLLISDQLKNVENTFTVASWSATPAVSLAECMAQIGAPISTPFMSS